MKTISLLMAFMIALSGCASTYSGPGPNFNLTGAEAEIEYRKFEFETGFFSAPATGFYAMGPEPVFYKAESLDPIVQGVSPVGWGIEERARWWRYPQWGLLIGAVAYALTILVSGEPDDISWPVYYSLLAGSVASSIRGNYLHRKAMREYNQDLKNKFKRPPSVSLNLLSF